MTGKKLATCALALLAFVFTQHAAATVEWLISQQRPDGAIAAAADVATPNQSTSEALRAIKGAGTAYDPTAALSFLTSEPYRATEYVCRSIAAAAGAGHATQAWIQELLSRRHSDGSFGEYGASAGNLLDTVFAAEALAAAGHAGTTEAGMAIGYLLTQQSATGAWPGPDGAASIYVTAHGLRALWAYRHRFNVTAAVGNARQYLLSQRDASALWGEAHLSALALAAIVPTLGDRFSVRDSLDALLASRQADGSYGSDTYTTALAVQALATAEQPFEDRVSLQGRVIDGDTGLPLPGAEVRISGPASAVLTTAENGTFAFESQLAGNYSLVVSYGNYAPVSATSSLRPGQQANFGDFALLRGNAPTTAVLRGQVTDKITGGGLAGVTIEIVGLELSAVTDAAGNFQIGAVPPGLATIVARRDGYGTAQGSTNFVAGQIFNFSPQLSVVASTFVRVSGVITDASTSNPLPGVEVAVTNSAGTVSTATDERGAYEISNLAAGALTATATLSGYHSVTGSINAAAGMHVTFSPALTPVDVPPPPPPVTGAVAGHIVDSISGVPLSGVTVRFFVGSTQRGSAATDVEGRFLIGNIVGAGELRISRSNYRAQTLPVTIAANTGVDIGSLELVPNSLANGGAFRGVVLDALTNAPRSGVLVTAVFGTTTRTDNTDSAGRFELTGLNPLQGTATLTRAGYETMQLGLVLALGEVVDLGAIYVRPVDTDEVSGDLTVQALSASAVEVDANSFAVSGNVAVTFANTGSAPLTGDIRIKAFSDFDHDGRLDAQGDVVIGETSVPVDLAAGALASATITVGGTLPFRDAPIAVMIDADNALIEQSEDNNVDTTAGVCRSSQRLAVDLGLCMDSSGSISAPDFQLQLQGTAAAIENASIIPHDGSVRLTVMQFDSATRVEVPPTVLDASNAATLAARIRAIRKSNGGTAIHSCINTATQQLSNALPAAAVRVIDLATDGGSNLAQAQQASSAAEAAGIDALNALAVGSGADLNVLNAIVFPRTSGPDAGFVVEIDTFEQYAEAIAAKIRREARTADLTVGRLQIRDEGTFVTLSVRVGNGGSRSIAAGVQLTFYSGDPANGGIALGSVTLPQLTTGEFVDVTLPNVTTLSGGETVYAVGDPAGTVGECNTQNNVIASAAGLLRGELTVATDAPVYAPQSAVQLSAQIVNRGVLAGDFVYRLQIEDAQGGIVTTFAATPTGTIAAGATAMRTQEWNTGTHLAGVYRLRGVLTLQDGTSVAESLAQFAIEHDSQSAAASLRVTTDRTTYNTTDSVALDALVRNLTVSTIIRDAVLNLAVRDPAGNVVFQQSIAIGDLVAGGMTQRDFTMALAAAAEGNYLVTGTVANGGGQLLASDSRSFAVNEDVAMTLRGTVSVAASTVIAGDPQSCTSTVENQGRNDVGMQALRLAVISLADESQVQSSEFSAALPAGGSHTDARPVATSGFATADYACVLQAMVNGAWQTLDYETFHVERPPIRLDASMAAGARGRLLVLMDGTGGWPCTPIRDIELWTPFRVRLPNDARIDVELLDASDRRVDFESITLSQYSGSINRARGNGADLSISGASADVLTVRIASNTALGEGYRVVATASGGTMPPVVVESNVMGSSCGWHAGIGARFGDFHCSSGRSTSGGNLPPPLQTLPTLAQQREFLEQLLEERGWSYKIVTDDETFERELRTGQYSQYALFAEHEKLDQQVQKELREAVYRGEGLLDAGQHDHRHHAFDDALGIKPVGRHAHADGVQIHAPWTTPGSASLFFEHDALKVRLTGAQPAAKYTGVHSYDTAIASHEYGRGKSVYVGYDLLAEATRAGADSLHAQLLANSLDQVGPAVEQAHSGQVMAVTITVANIGGVATPGRIALPLPAGVTLIDSGDAQLVDGSLVWSFSLDVEEQFVAHAWVRLPEQAGAVLFDAQVQSGTEGSYVDQAHATLNVDTLDRATIADARTLAAGSLHFIGVRLWLDKAQFWLDLGNPYFALASLVQAADATIRVSHPRAAELRWKIDDAIWQLGRELE